VREIHISGHAVNTAQQFLAGRPDEFHCLLVTDVDYPFPEEIRGLVRDVLHLAFDDACFPTGLNRLADRAAVQQALAWAEGRDKLLIACHAGISRSAALAFLIACTDRPPEQALSLLDPGKHRPNDLVVMLGSTVLGDRRIWDAFFEWCRMHEVGDWHQRLRFLEEWGTERETKMKIDPGPPADY
jgi:predicted protein tyrosine phosphatase